MKAGRYRLTWRVAWPLLGLTLLLAGQLHAQTVEQGLALFDDGNFVAARQVWLPLADQGDARANFYLSQLYAQGKGVEANHRLALAFLAVAAREGFAPAEYNLGNQFHAGKWVPQSDTQAEHWWRLAAKQNMPQAQHNLGSLYLVGGEIPVNVNKARYWYRRAAANGSVASAQMLKKLQRDLATGEASHKKPASGPLGSDWIMKQPTQMYTLQLLASNSAASARRLARRYRSKGQIAVYRFENRGRVLYGVVYGRFHGIKQARTAVADLPAELRQSAPWPRSFGDLQKIIKS